jgi:hypothetical protein
MSEDKNRLQIIALQQAATQRSFKEPSIYKPANKLLFILHLKLCIIPSH